MNKDDLARDLAKILGDTSLPTAERNELIEMFVLRARLALTDEELQAFIETAFCCTRSVLMNSKGEGTGLRATRRRLRIDESNYRSGFDASV